MRTSLRARGLAIGAAIGLLACAAGAACGARPRSPDTLVDSIRGYNEGVRWGRFAAAASRVPPRERSQFVADMDERAEDLKITDYEIVNVEARGEREARVQVKLSWYRTAEGTLRETHAMQTWERQGGAWMMVAEARVRGAQMPGLPEPAGSLAPMSPAGSLAPMNPAGSLAPMSPADSPGPADRTVSADRPDPADPANPANPANPADPADPRAVNR